MSLLARTNHCRFSLVLLSVLKDCHQYVFSGGKCSVGIQTSVVNIDALSKENVKKRPSTVCANSTAQCRLSSRVFVAASPSYACVCACLLCVI